jgi:hypothetical protein
MLSHKQFQLLLPSRRCPAVLGGRLLARLPKTTLCGHPKQGFRGTRNQSLAIRVEVGFLGNLCQRRLHARSFPTTGTYHSE